MPQGAGEGEITYDVEAFKSWMTDHGHGEVTVAAAPLSASDYPAAGLKDDLQADPVGLATQQRTSAADLGSLLCPTLPSRSSPSPVPPLPDISSKAPSSDATHRLAG